MTSKACPVCSAPVAEELPGGLCPACLMAAAARSQPQIEETAALAHRGQPPKPGELDDLFPELEIVELIGSGGMGAVYKARQRNLDRLVALKIFLFNDNNQQFTDRFAREARALARLNHANVVTVHDFGQRGRYHFLLMEYVDGLNLRQIVQSKKLAPVEALELVPQLCDALQYAHDNDVVHRDIKPENVLLDRSGKVKIADFGLAKLTDQSELALTGTRQVMGTLNYMAPEQRERPSEVDHRADIYSLGVVIYELLTGELPLGRFEPPSQKIQVDVRLDEIVMRALEKDPVRRYQQASEFKTGVQSVSHLVPRQGAAAQGATAQGAVPKKPVKAAMHGWQKMGKPADDGIKTIPQLIYFAVALFFCCAGALILVLSSEDYFPSWSRYEQLPGLLIVMFGGFLFACSWFVGQVFSKETTTGEKMLAAFGMLAMMVGFVGASLFIVASKIDEYERTLRAVAMSGCILCGFLFAIYGVVAAMLEKEQEDGSE